VHAQYSRLCTVPPESEAMTLGAWLDATGGGEPTSDKGRAWDAAHVHWRGGQPGSRGRNSRQGGAKGDTK
jgi:hypothetical protein